eukprot:5671431-Lingulodinium_polyedra.AAC.1
MASDQPWQSASSMAAAAASAVTAERQRQQTQPVDVACATRAANQLAHGEKQREAAISPARAI